MPSFSQRIGQTPLTPVVQLEGMSPELRTSLWNVLYQRVQANNEAYWLRLAHAASADFFKTPADELSNYAFECRNWVKQQFFALPWYRAYDLLEYYSERARDLAFDDPARSRLHFNQVLEREGSGYRFIDDALAPISSTTELVAIEQGIELSRQFGVGGAATHLHTAVALLAKRPDPDYRNSIKESISAVESVAKALSGSETGGLKDALKIVSQRVQLHGSLEAALKSLYGYTSDAGGIRHALLDDPASGFDEAKFMLVTCSAFVYFLMSKAHLAGLV